MANNTMVLDGKTFVKMFIRAKLTLMFNAIPI